MTKTFKLSFKMKYVLLASLLLVSGCASIIEPIIRSHGYTPTTEDLNTIKSQNLTQNEISNLLGKPFIIGTYNPNYWYYISYRTNRFGFAEKKIENFKIVEMFFTNGKLKKVTTFNKDNLVKFEFSKDKSKTSGKELGILDQFIGNIGKFRVPETSN